MTTTTKTACQQAADDLATLKAAKLKIATGGGMVRMRSGDQDIEFSPANLTLLARMIADTQALVDACAGRRTGRAMRIAPTGW